MAQLVKNLPANAGDIGDDGSIPGLERSTGGGHGNPLQLFVPGESYGQRSLAGYGPRVAKELDMTEQLNNNNQKEHISRSTEVFLLIF